MRSLRSFLLRSCRSLNSTWTPACPFSPLRRFSISVPNLRQLDMDTVNTSERLATLRDLMKKHQVDVYAVLWSEQDKKKKGKQNDRGGERRCFKAKFCRDSLEPRSLVFFSTTGIGSYRT